MFTANSMNCLCEAIGLALPGNGIDPRHVPASVTSSRKRAATRLMRLRAARASTFRDIVTARAIDNAVALDVAMGGSTNTVLHVLALAREAEVDYPLARFNEVAERTPHLAKISPAWDGDRQWHMQDVHAAGGIPAILAELREEARHARSRRADGHRADARRSRSTAARPTQPRVHPPARQPTLASAARSRCSSGHSRHSAP